ASTSTRPRTVSSAAIATSRPEAGRARETMPGRALTDATGTGLPRAVVLRVEEPVLLLADEAGGRPPRNRGVTAPRPRPPRPRAVGGPAAGVRQPPAIPRPDARRLSPATRRAVLTIHILASVALLGDCAVIVALNIRAATTDDATLAASAYELLTMMPTL